MIEFFDIPQLIASYGYIGIFLIVFLESGIFFALPGDSLLFTAGILASTNILSIQTLIPLIFVATFLGGIFGYFVGMHIARLQRYSLFRRILKDKHLEIAEKFFAKHGKLTVVLSRFVPIVRTFAPIVAGIVRMPYKLFIKYSFIGSLLWSFSMTLLGYFLGQIIPQIKDYLSVFIILVVILSILPVIFEIFKGKKTKV
jgi:membrane-associated protein